MSRAAAIARLLADEDVKAVFEELRQDCIADWERTADNDPQRRETAWRSLKALERIKDRLQAIVDNERLSEAQNRSRA